MREFVGGDVLSEDTRELMVGGVDVPGLGLGVQYGLRVIMRETEVGPAIGHSGWFPGYLSIV